MFKKFKKSFKQKRGEVDLVYDVASPKVLVYYKNSLVHNCAIAIRHLNEFRRDVH